MIHTAHSRTLKAFHAVVSHAEEQIFSGPVSPQLVPLCWSDALSSELKRRCCVRQRVRRRPNPTARTKPHGSQWTSTRNGIM